jgi:hypothetical protein
MMHHFNFLRAQSDRAILGNSSHKRRVELEGLVGHRREGGRDRAGRKTQNSGYQSVLPSRIYFW